jgi:hypothetical protein
VWAGAGSLRGAHSVGVSGRVGSQQLLHEALLGSTSACATCLRHMLTPLFAPTAAAAVWLTCHVECCWQGQVLRRVHAGQVSPDACGRQTNKCCSMQWVSTDCAVPVLYCLQCCGYVLRATAVTTAVQTAAGVTAAAYNSLLPRLTRPCSRLADS